MAKHSKPPVRFGQVIVYTADGPLVFDMALVRQRRVSKTGDVFQLTECPTCGEIHVHSDGDGPRVRHCLDPELRRQGTGQDWIMASEEPPVPYRDPYPRDITYRLRSGPLLRRTLLRRRK